MYKPGYKTSEFWFTLVSFIFSALFLFGIIKDNDTKDELIGIFTHGVESIILIGGQVLIFYRYLKSRNTEKIAYEKRLQNKYDEIDQEIKDYVGIDNAIEKININDTNIGELIQLPHIGPTVAKNILEYQTIKGPFQNLEDLKNINGIGEQTFNIIKPYLYI